MPSRSQTAGLPNGPRSRSHGRQRPADYDSPPPSRGVRQQKSLASMRSDTGSSRGGFSGAPPLPGSRSGQHRYAPSDTSSSRSSDDSIFSTASSFLDRVRAGTGYASSRTSLDDADPPPKPQSSRTRNMRRSQDDVYDESAPNNAFGFGMGDGSTVWSALSNAASNMTVNISKSWATNIPVFAGEETPAGAESRLTRAMRAYHREKAQTPADLPAWLFDEHERRMISRATEGRAPRSRGYTSEVSDDYEAPSRPAPSRGLRDIYQRAAATSEPPVDHMPRRAAQESAPPSKASDRLKAMRDAKRGANQSSSSSSYKELGNQDRGSERAPQAPRAGLPSGPGRVRRF